MHLRFFHMAWPIIVVSLGLDLILTGVHRKRGEVRYRKCDVFA